LNKSWENKDQLFTFANLRYIRMSKSIAEEFLKESNEKSSDLNQREVIAQHIGQYNLAFEKGKERFHNLSNAQKKANLVKWRVMENLDRYLIEFESNFKQRGGHVIWANTMAEAHNETCPRL